MSLYIARHGHRADWVTPAINSTLSVATPTTPVHPDGGAFAHVQPIVPQFNPNPPPPQLYTSSNRKNDPYLSETGLTQAKQLGTHMAAVSPNLRILVSPYLRTLQTAKAVSDAIFEKTGHRIKLCIEWGLREWYDAQDLKAAFPVMSFDQYQTYFPDEPITNWIDVSYKSSMPAPSTTDDIRESVIQLKKRCRQVIPYLVKCVQQAYPNTSILCVTHAAAKVGLVKAVIGPTRQDEEVRCGVCSLTKLDFVPSDNVGKGENPYTKWRDPWVGNGEDCGGNWEKKYETSFLETGEDHNWVFAKWDNE